MRVTLKGFFILTPFSPCEGEKDFNEFTRERPLQSLIVFISSIIGLISYMGALFLISNNSDLFGWAISIYALFSTLMFAIYWENGMKSRAMNHLFSYGLALIGGYILAVWVRPAI